MRRLPILLVLFLCGAAGATRAQNGPVKIKTKDGVTVIRDKSKPVRHALEQQYESIRRAIFAKDLDTILQLRTPDFEAHMPNGEVWDFETSKQYTQRGFEQVQKNLDVRFVLHEIQLEGDTAAAEIEQHWSRLQLKAGKLRTVETSARQRETWVLTPQGWRLRRIDQIRPGAWYVDGKRIDPTKPYNPDAPPYEGPK